MDIDDDESEGQKESKSALVSFMDKDCDDDYDNVHITAGHLIPVQEHRTASATHDHHQHMDLDDQKEKVTTRY